MFDVRRFDSQELRSAGVACVLVSLLLVICVLFCCEDVVYDCITAIVNSPSE